MKPAPPAALLLGLVCASFHSACLAEGSSGDNSTLTSHHPDPEPPEQCHAPGAGPSLPPRWPPLGLASTGSGYGPRQPGHQLWKLCTEVCFCDSRRSSSRMALMSEAEEWPGWRSSVELAA
uniref:Transmembrane protein 213 n=1 Tax=Molossus molossus TaxID=27622 RepID=A0A7J8HEX2_MOLMO|nr:transmembrane protein 213 [Molossus molossus]